MSNAALCLHASAVAIAGRGVLILGASGSGKSSLALELMALGAGLIADDQTFVAQTVPGRSNNVTLDCPPALQGRIEARFIGLLNATPHPPAPLHLVVDLDQAENQRLPPHRTWSFQGTGIPLLFSNQNRCFPAAIHQYVTHGRSA